MDKRDKLTSEIYDELLIKYINSNDKEKTFLEIIDFINQNPIIFDSIFLINLFERVDNDTKINYWKLFVEHCNVSKKFVIQEVFELLNLHKSPDEKVMIFTMLLNADLLFSVHVNELIEIISYFGSKKYIILDLLIEHKLIGALLDYQIKELIFSLPTNEQKEMLFYLRKKIPDTLDDYVLLWIIQLFKTDDIYELFNELIINNENFNDEVLFRNLGCDINANLAFSLIDLYIKEKCKKYNYQEKKQLFKKVKKYIVDYSEVFCEEYPNGNMLYHEINKLTCQEYEFSLENFTKFISLFGYEAYHFIDCINVKKLLTLEPNEFMLILDLFTEKYTTLTQHTLNNILNAFYQREFLLEKKEEYTIFGELERLINEKNKIEISKKLQLIAQTIDLSSELAIYQFKLDDFINKLLAHDQYTKEILHKIANKYLMILREHYVTSKIKNAHCDLQLVQRIEKNIAKKELFANKSLEEIIKLLLSIDTTKLSDNQIALLNNKHLLEQAILYKISPYEENFDNHLYHALSELEKILNILWEDGRLTFSNKNKLKYVYVPEKIKKGNLLSVIAELDIDNLSKTLLNNHLIYEKLTKLLEKYKIMGWGNTFNLLSKKIDLTIDASMIAGIINYFYIIYPEILQDNHFSLTKLITYGNCYSSVSNKYAYLLGEEEYKLICANNGNYKAPAPKNKRLELAVKHLQEMYQKESITIPSYDQNYLLSNSKIINAVVGNATSMKNLTIGERTDSCLRICGIFYELYKFIIKDKNGFNICFYDQNGNFISRVSGIRNGNTIFFNQLRDSLSPAIKNTDLHEVLTMISNDLIAMTTESDVPIDNVIISPQCALASQDKYVQYIGEDIFANELYKLPFNYDMDGFALLLASRAPGKYTKRLTSKELPLYKCCGDKIMYYENEEQANKRFIQFVLINEVLNGTSFDKIQIPNNKIKKCISGDKFLIAQGCNDEIFTIILDKFKDDKDIKETINKILNNLNFTNNGGIKR